MMTPFRFGLVLTLLLQISSAFSQDPCYNTDPTTVVIPEAVNMLEALKRRLLPAMSASEADIVNAVTMCSATSPALLGIKNVGALLPKDSAPIIVFGFDALNAVQEIGIALTVARVPGVHTSYFDGYLRYRSSIYRFRETPMLAAEFAVRLGPPGIAARLKSLPESEWNQGLASGEQVILFVVAHELAHHVLGHVHAERPPDIQRKAETDADLWAVSKLVRIGVDPSLATAFMLMLNEIESKSTFAKSQALHPPAFKRALDIVIEQDRLVRKNPEWIDTSMLTLSGQMPTPSVKVLAHLARLEKLRVLYTRTMAEEARLNEDNEFLLQKAQSGSTSSRIALADSYATGKRKGFKKNWDDARTWMLLAADGSAPYEHDFRADAQYFVGTLNLASGGDQTLGCDSLRKAASVNHLFAAEHLRIMISKGICQLSAGPKP